jgi:hypothetical protein
LWAIFGHFASGGSSHNRRRVAEIFQNAEADIGKVKVVTKNFVWSKQSLNVKAKEILKRASNRAVLGIVNE